MSAFEREVLRIIFVRTKVNKNCRKQYNKTFMQLFGDLYILLFVRTGMLNCSGHVNRMDSKRKEVRYVIIIPREVY
jgi:hypothetical protein